MADVAFTATSTRIRTTSFPSAYSRTISAANPRGTSRTAAPRERANIREVKVKGAPGPIFYSRSHDAFVYVIYPTKDEGPTHVAVTYPDGTSAEPVPVSVPEEEAGDTSTLYDYGLLYVE